MNNNQAYDEGYDAYWEGVDVSDNPYDEEKEADARLAWEQGWAKPANTITTRTRGKMTRILEIHAAGTSFGGTARIICIVTLVMPLGATVEDGDLHGYSFSWKFEVHA